MLWVSLTNGTYVYSVSFHLHRYGLVGLLRPLTVYPSEMVYWAV